jgi:superfamily II DNA or RNA helicase
VASPDTIYIAKVNEVFIKVTCEPSIAQELCDFFTFYVPGYKFMPSYRSKVWDGKIRLYSIYDNLLYSGLLYYVILFSQKRSYHVIFLTSFDIEPVTLSSDYIDSLKLQSDGIQLTIRDYQLDAFTHVLSVQKALLISPTASGKSLIIYLLVRYLNLSTLIVVPTTSLVEQMYKDFQDYSVENGWSTEDNCHRIYAGHERDTEKPVVISTWQSIHRLKKPFFERFCLVIGDEAHGFKSKSLISIMTKLVNAKYRVGTTGTLDGTQTHQLVLEGLFGPVKQVTTTKELMDTDILADLNVHCIVLGYSEQECKMVKAMDYKQEIDFLVGNPKRNQFITNMVSALSGNTLVLYQLVEKHGDILFQMMSEALKDKIVRYIHGGIKTDIREEIREEAENNDNVVIVASYGTYSTGVNIRNLDNVVFASPSKSRIRNLQSIGRALRRKGTNTNASLLDIADDLSHKSYQNYTLQHLIERIKIYNSEKFDYRMKKFTL